MNRRPSSTVNCRPLELEFTKETNNFIKIKAQEIKDAIKNLKVTTVNSFGNEYKVSHRVLLTMIDGKVSSAVTNTGAATCNVCKAKPSEMNNIDGVLKRECSSSSLEIALPVLHLNIRFLEYFMNIAKRLNVAERCYGQYTEQEKEGMKKRHAKICKDLSIDVGIIVDKTTSKGGNTNTGNTARRFFEEAVKVCTSSYLLKN